MHEHPANRFVSYRRQSSVSSDSFELLQVPMRQSTSNDVKLQSEGAINSTERTTEQEDDHEVMHLTDLLKQV